MYIKHMSDTYAVSGQIHPEDIPTIKKAGFRTIMCNRPDDESDDQTPAHVIEKTAKEHGIDFHHVPLGHAGIAMAALKQFSKVVNDGNNPVLAYCHTGGRCSRMWAAFTA